MSDRAVAGGRLRPSTTRWYWWVSTDLSGTLFSTCFETADCQPSRLDAAGVFGELETFIPTWSPAIWTSIVTGKVPSKHGITAFVHSPDEKGVRRLYTNRDRRSKAIWNILTDSGRSVATVGWWMTFPVEEINGVMVAQVNTSTPDAQPAGEGVWKGDWSSV